MENEHRWAVGFIFQESSEWTEEITKASSEGIGNSLEIESFGEASESTSTYDEREIDKNPELQEHFGLWDLL